MTKVKKSKSAAASKSFNDEVALLLKLAADAPGLTFPQRKSEAKLFEIAVLTEILDQYKFGAGGWVDLRQPTNGIPNCFAGAPASADKTQFAWFELIDHTGATEAEAWISVQFTGLSAELAHEHGAASYHPAASRHELDITLLRPDDPALPTLRPYPLFREILAAVSVKHVSKLNKESIREALGFRRELGLLSGPHSGSECRWLEHEVPCNPASPLFLVSSAPNFKGYTGQIDQLGLFPKYMKFPW